MVVSHGRGIWRTVLLIAADVAPGAVKAKGAACTYDRYREHIGIGITPEFAHRIISCSTIEFSSVMCWYFIVTGYPHTSRVE